MSESDLQLNLDESIQENGAGNSGDVSSSESKTDADLSKEVNDDSSQESAEDENGVDHENGKEDEEDEHTGEDEEENGEVEDEKEDEKTDVAESTGKRIRKKVDRLSMASTPASAGKKKEVNFSGGGLPLNKIEFIEHMITKAKKEDLKTLHHLIFKRPGSGNEIRANLRKFEGFGYKKTDPEYEKLELKISKVLRKDLAYMSEVLGLEKSGTVKQISERVLEFLNKPVDNEKKIPQKKSKSKRKSTQKKKTPKKVLKKPSKGKKKKEEEEEEEEEEDEEESGEEEREDSSDSEEKKTKATKKPKTPAKKAATPKKPAKNGVKRKRVVAESDDSEDDLPLIKKKKAAPPTNEEIEAFLKLTLKEIDLEEVTMKQMYQKVYDNYPGFDLADRKDFIKTFVKSSISA